MSTKHPVIAVTGSSGAGTTTVMKSFAHIFRRETIKDPNFYGQFFTLVQGYASQEKLSQAAAPTNRPSPLRNELPDAAPAPQNGGR